MMRVPPCAWLYLLCLLCLCWCCMVLVLNPSLRGNAYRYQNTYPPYEYIPPPMNTDNTCPHRYIPRDNTRYISINTPYLYGVYLISLYYLDYMSNMGLLINSNNAILITSKRHGGTNLRAKRRRVRARPSNQEGHEIRKRNA